MQSIGWVEFQQLLHKLPLMVEMHPLTRAFLPKEVRVFEDPYEMAAFLDNLEASPPQPLIAIGHRPELSYRFHTVRLEHDPLTPELNTVLPNRYELIQSSISCQSRIAELILQSTDVEGIILMLIDGLSYEDVKRYAPDWLPYTQPVLVDGVSITEQGFIRIIGQPPLAERLFQRGFHQITGYTYWTRNEEPLTDRVFRGFGNEVYKVKSFREVLESIKELSLSRAFIQIIRTGQDASAHIHRENPLKKAMIKAIFEDFEKLIEVVKDKIGSAAIYLSSDHGILWKDEHELRNLANDSGPARYYEHHKNESFTRPAEFEGKHYALLTYPYLRRPLRSNEWGVHGGLSFQESIVPLIQIKI